MELVEAGFRPEDLGEFSESAYLTYALMTVRKRALPRVEDGLKPVHKRILYAMYRMGLLTAVKPVKCAKTTGTVIGNYHPHGDSAVYEAMVRMAQDFSLRYPLIDGQGNFGSRDGASPAAQRYTECKLSPIAELLLDELDKGSVNYIPNYDETEQEPEVLPARLPFLLLNGIDGIAVGLKTDVPSHNLREVAEACIAYLQKGDGITLEELLSHITVPDFHGGGILTSSVEDVRSMYETGRGLLKVRAKWHYEELPRGLWQLVVTEMPPDTCSKKVVERLDSLYNPQPKKKGDKLTQVQLNLRTLSQSLMEDVLDESDRNHKMRLVIKPKTSKVDRKVLEDFLLTHTPLESTVSCNFNVLDASKVPRMMPLKVIIGDWVVFRKQCVRRRTEFKLEIVNKRLELLRGRKLILVNVDEALKIIRNSDSPKTELMAHFSLSEVQAEDILEMRLRQISKLDDFKLDTDIKNLEKEKQGLEKLREEKHLVAQIVSEIRADALKFGDDRRTEWKPISEEVTKKSKQSASVVFIDEPVTVMVSEQGWIRSRVGHALNADNATFKTGDSLRFKVECQKSSSLVILDSTGRTYGIYAKDLPQKRGDDLLLYSQIELAAGATILGIYILNETQGMLFSTSTGYGFIAPMTSLFSRLKAGKQVVKLEENAKLLPPSIGVITEGVPQGLIWCEGKGKGLLFKADEIKVMDKGKGVILQDTPDMVQATWYEALPEDRPELLSYLSSRAKKGKKL